MKLKLTVDSLEYKTVKTGVDSHILLLDFEITMGGEPFFFSMPIKKEGGVEETMKKIAASIFGHLFDSYGTFEKYGYLKTAEDKKNLVGDYGIETANEAIETIDFLTKIGKKMHGPIVVNGVDYKTAAEAYIEESGPDARAKILEAGEKMFDLSFSDEAVEKMKEVIKILGIEEETRKKRENGPDI